MGLVAWLQGFAARVFQHELDHLNGIVYLDRVKSNKDIIMESQQDVFVAALPLAEAKKLV